MALNRKFVMILAILMLGTVFLTGCGDGEETGLDGGTGITDPSDVPGEEGTDLEGDTGEEEIDPAGEGEEEEEEAATSSGILKAADGAAGTVTIESKTDGELVLEVNDKSKILEGESQITFDDLADNIGSKVIAEYDEQTKVVKVMGILD
ncbi:MAG: hypothetical protein WCS98_08285 [Bacillota bacterium]|nr:hypothetical protein [Bacillota bacterium]MDD3298938.1 hypothetical protein [Bacillota bacterium]MDD3851357.1 hypothetical protein [Bacillota bacterium]MDD4707992.1 hypothetical protein [Bacillota bacterium]